MVRVARWVLIACLAMLFNVADALQGQTGSLTPIPKWTVKLDAYGWHPPRPESNKAFFRGFTIAKLEAMDENARIRFVSNDVVVVFHSNEQGRIGGLPAVGLKHSLSAQRTGDYWTRKSGQRSFGGTKAISLTLKAV